MYILQVTEENHRALSTDTVEGKFRRLDSLVNTKINTGFQFISSGSFSFALYADYTYTIAKLAVFQVAVCLGFIAKR